MTNEERAARAFGAVMKYKGTDTLEMESHIRDSVCDLLHLAEQHGLDPMAELRAGLLSYLPERDDPSGDGWMTEYEAEIYTRLVRDHRAA